MRITYKALYVHMYISVPHVTLHNFCEQISVPRVTLQNFRWRSYIHAQDLLNLPHFFSWENVPDFIKPSLHISVPNVTLPNFFWETSDQGVTAKLKIY
jgi:hypothetical protein